MADASQLERQLLEAQNADGGWGYDRGTSWTEPTALALSAFHAYQQTGTSEDVEVACQGGRQWLVRTQRLDGGWPPNPRVPISTWVTSLAALVLGQDPDLGNTHNRAIRWLLSQIEPENSPFEQLLVRLIGASPPSRTLGGSPWLPHTAPWIAPTAFSILALQQAVCGDAHAKLRSSIEQAQQYILCHRCRDGGWNHGGAPYLSENARSYPEMTGLALLALYGAPAADLARPFKLAESYVRSPQSNEALCWINLALARHGRNLINVHADLPCRNTRDVALRLLALSAQSPTNGLVIAAT